MNFLDLCRHTNNKVYKDEGYVNDSQFKSLKYLDGNYQWGKKE